MPPAERCDGSCSCNPPASVPLTRRGFLKATGAGAAAVFTGGLARAAFPMAGPFTAEDFRHLVPEDKKLTPEWIASLYRRGEPRVLRGAELKYAGMPVGGIACGQLYLGGDGRLWHWEIFRPHYRSPYGSLSRGIHYADPPLPTDPREHPLQHGFALRVETAAGTITRTLDREGFKDIAFRGTYPIGRIQYRDASLPVAVDLEAFSPFIPLRAADSAIPCSLLHYTVRNTSDTKLRVTIAGWLENAVCPEESAADDRVRRTTLKKDGFLFSARVKETPQPAGTPRPDILFEDFEGEDYGAWRAEGTAFGKRPFRLSELPSFHKLRNASGKGFVNTHDVRRVGPDAVKADRLTGTLTSPEFTIERRYIAFRVCGGAHRGKTEVRLEIREDSGWKVLGARRGRNDSVFRTEFFDVGRYQGRRARIVIADEAQGSWGHICADRFVFTDRKPEGALSLEETFGYGTLALKALARPEEVEARSVHVKPGKLDAAVVFAALDEGGTQDATYETPFDRRPAAALSQTVELEPGEERTLAFILAWHFPYFPQPSGEMGRITGLERLKRHYAKRYEDAWAVARDVEERYGELAGTTRLWVETWYDATLPYWLLDRVMTSADCLATTVLYWFDSGRVWGWEGTDCCPGTCQHVWNYAQAMARLFPELERALRAGTDFGLAWHENGAIDYRAENARSVAHDGLAGTVMRVWREHTMSPDASFLAGIWPRVKRTIEYLIAYDGDANGLIEREQYNTLDQAWVGPMGWISSIYLGALAAGEAMAREMGDSDFARRCRSLLERGRTNIVRELFDGEYFIHKPPHFRNTNTNRGCHIDQVLGQSWACHYGLARAVPRKETLSALRSIWRYNFTPDAGAYRNAMQKVIKGGRWYAMPGEAGTIMTTWPKGGAEKARGTDRVFEWAVGYFNECMNGFEYQVGAHMIWEGEPGSDLVEKGLAVTRAVHDRYAPERRNPFNEIECSDHYSRSMASFGVYQACLGFEYHGPAGRIGFAPRLSPDDFRAAFTAAEGWGTFTQKRNGERMEAEIALRFGRLRLRALSLAPRGGPSHVRAELDGRPLEAALRLEDGRAVIDFSSEVVIDRGAALRVELG